MKDLTLTVLRDFPGKRIAILGDLVADQFLRGTISRVSREAPVFILRHDETETLPGGAANAAANIASLGGTASLVGLVGKDTNGSLLTENLASTGVNCDLVVSSDKVSTTTKVRVLAAQHYAARQQVIRIDYENTSEIGDDILGQLRENLTKAAKNADAIIVSDYGYGAADPRLMETARRLSAEGNIPLIVDSRYRLRDLSDATTATPNQEEIETILGTDFTDADCDSLRDELHLQALLVTCGNEGMLLVERDKKPLRLEAVGGLEPVDVTGAGDTVIAVYGLGIASGLSFADAAKIANHAGGLVVMKKGTASVSAEELIRSLSTSSAEPASQSAS
ncbi:MAG: PfkB family carbohydrate kinase [Acidobacteriota bacterium]